MIPEGHSANFDTLKRAVEDNAVCLMECTDKITGKPVYTICAMNLVDGEIAMVPIAKLFDGNPYEELNPPT